MMLSNKTLQVAGVCVLIVLIVAWAIGSYMIATHVEDAVITVSSKERLMQLSTDSEGRSSTSYVNYVYAEDIYVVRDSLWLGHFTSGTVYANISEGATCRVRLSGYRVGFFSMFQNIVEAECDPSAEDRE